MVVNFIFFSAYHLFFNHIPATVKETINIAMVEWVFRSRAASTAVLTRALMEEV